jgi:hypothetical protein
MNTKEYLEWFDDVVGPTEQMFLKVPPDKLDFRITAGSFTVGQLIDHIPRSLSFNAKVIAEVPLPVRSIREILIANRYHPISNVDEAVHFLRASVSEFKKSVEQFGDMRFQTAILDTPQRGMILAWKFCLFVMEHHIHHLMELHIALKCLGVQVNTRTLYVG